MAQPASAASPDYQTALLLVGAILLGLVGMALLGYAIRIRSRALERRVGLIEPKRVSDIAPEDQAKVIARRPLSLRLKPGALSERAQREIARRMAALRIPAQSAAAAFLGIRFACIAGLGLGTFILARQWHLFSGKTTLLVAVTAMFAIVGWFIPAIIVGRMAKKRSKTAAAGLPEALELLVVCINAGLALEDSIDRMVIELRRSNPELADEFALTSADLKILPSREKALMGLADRIDVPSVRSVVTTLSQSMRYGTPLAQAMQVVATDMRNESLIAMEERANRLPTLMTLPMMLFIMPTIFLIVGGPAGLRIMDAFMK